MTRIEHETSWARLRIDTGEGSILCQERWQYTWTRVPPASSWTLRERRRFHATLDRQVWSRWGHVRLFTSGDHELCRRHPTVRVVFDVRWVLSSPHWSVTVRKLPRGSDPTTFISHVLPNKREIHLDSADVNAYRPRNAAGQSRTFQALPHEFGHTFENPDEYVSGSPSLPDADSIMNIGSRVRARHLHLIVEELAGLLPGCTFTA